MGKRQPDQTGQSRLLDARGRPIGGPIDRRTFVKTSSGILLAAGVGGACSTDPATAATVIVNITGIPAGASNGGSAVVTRTDEAGWPVITIPVPATGQGRHENIEPGNYDVVYTPPAGFQQVLLSVVIEPQEIETINITLTPSTIPQGTLRVSVSGLSGTATGGGTAVLQRTDASAAPINATVAVGGAVNTLVDSGTYTVTYTPPAGHTLSGSGVQTNQVVTTGNTTTVSFAVTQSTSFLPPNLLANLSFETNFDGYTDGGGSNPTNLTRATDQAFDGTTALKYVWAANAADSGSNCFHALPNAVDEIWHRFYVRLAAGWSITTIQKFQLYREPGFGIQYGGWELNNSLGFSWSFFIEASAVGSSIIPKASISTDAWHSLECHYKRNGDPLPSVAFWFDGVQVTKPDGPDPNGNGLNWVGGRLVGGPTRGSSAKIGVVNLLGTRNGGNSGAGTLWLDKVAASTAGRIGP